MKELSGKVAVVTGASRGIGPYIARTLFQRGVQVVMAARTATDLEDERRKIDPAGDRTLAVAVDVSSASDCARLLEAAREAMGQVDILVNDAGLEGPEPYQEMDFERVRQVIEVNLVALMRLTHMALPEMLQRRSGHIVNIASLAGLSPVPFNTVYSATKHGVVGFSESLNYELRGTGVGVSVVCPGFIREAGMFTRYAGSGKGGVAGTNSPQEVADAVLDAITKGQMRAVVTPALARLTPVLSAAAPGVLLEVMRRGGVINGLRRTAERNHAARVKTPSDEKSSDGVAKARRGRRAATTKR